MKKVIFKEIDGCNKCPYFKFVGNPSRYEDEWYECGFTDKIIISEEDLMIKESTFDLYKWEIPDWCPLEDFDLFHKAISVVRDEE